MAPLVVKAKMRPLPPVARMTDLGPTQEQVPGS
jgi:hypothetical protein